MNSYDPHDIHDIEWPFEGEITWFPPFLDTSSILYEKKPQASASAKEPLSPSASFALGRFMARGLPGRAAESVGVLDGNSYWDVFDGS